LSSEKEQGANYEATTEANTIYLSGPKSLYFDHRYDIVQSGTYATYGKFSSKQI
jgi:hypothetical protein